MKAYLEAQVPGRIEVDLEPYRQLSKAKFPNITIVIYIWIAIDSASNAKTILRLLRLKG